MIGFEEEKQQLVLVQDNEDVSYPSVLEKNTTYTLMNVDEEQKIGVKSIPKNTNIRYRTQKHVMADSDSTEIEFYDEVGKVRVENTKEMKSSIGLIFDFH